MSFLTQKHFPFSLMSLLLLLASSLSIEPQAVARKKEAPPSLGQVYQFRSAYVDDDKQKPKGTLAWQVKLLGKVQSAAAIDNRSVYVATSTGSVFAFHKQKGVLQWQQALADPIDHASPALSDKHVIVASTSGKVYALNRGNGKKLWTFDAQSKMVATPFVAQLNKQDKAETVYVATRAGKIYALDAESGEQKWAYDTDNMLDASPVVFDGKLFIADYRGRCYAIDIETGKPLWFYTIDGPVVVPPVVVEDTVYFTTTNGALAALDIDTGEKRWRHMGLYSHPLIVPPIIMKDEKQGDRIYIADLEGTLSCVNAKSQTNLWQRQLSGVVVSAPVLSNGVLYVAMGDGQIWALNALTGVELWKTRVASMIESGLLVNHGYLYVGANSGRFYALK
ncbi:MAG: PQQ-binding-like beta-propeller repeat protein [Vampirovibrionales bacterium]|nr:PQQ-binding-like beta-propeller repeat protein [Vampirovibrionales bacterium]